MFMVDMASKGCQDILKLDQINGRIIVDFEAKGLWHAGYIGGRDRDLAVSEKDRREEYQWERLPVTAKLTDEQAGYVPRISVAGDFPITSGSLLELISSPRWPGI